MAIFFVELYEVNKDKKSKYGVLMKRIYRGLRQHAKDLPELLSYKTFEAGKEGTKMRFVEMFEFADQNGSKRFFGRFSKTEWLRALQQEFYELVPRSRMQVYAWTEFLKDEWLVR
jgi:hypothetical protein